MSINHFKNTYSLILASTSPRRREILSLLRIPFERVAPCYEEKFSKARSPFEEARLFAEEKAKSITHAPTSRTALILGSDTLIACEGKKIGKPKDKEDARGILKFLRGKWHEIYTGVALLDSRTGECESHVEIVKIFMKNFSEQELENYLNTDEPYDKAGAYALQGEGRKLIEEVEGDFISAIGLPLHWIAEHLKRKGFTLPDIPQSFNFK